ncbi:MAG: 2-polyprenylphenol 6-hydroxylase [Sphingobacteriia bacterium]|nr:2-polyprenylphenol 6-hydroxylase [Sphingobacteriia bacterium]
MMNYFKFIYFIIIFIRYKLWAVFSEKDYESGLRLARALQKLGPAFIKLGQTLSTRPDIIGSNVALALTKLQDNLPPFEYKFVEETFIKEFGVKPEYFFPVIERPAVAAASIAQVHKVQACGGKYYAVKILRPNIDKIIDRDIKFFHWGAKKLEKYFPATRRLKPKSVIETFAEAMRLELDLRLEAAAASELKDNLKDDLGIKIPEINWNVTSKRILTIEWVEGIPINDLNQLKEKGYNLKKIASNLAINFFNQAYRDGFFHGDMHPGNLFVDSDYNIVLVDFGIVGRLGKQTRIYVAEILRGFLSRDYLHVAKIHFEAGYVPHDKCLFSFAQACRSIGEPIIGLPSNQISVGKLLSQLFDITREFDMETQPQLLLFQKTLVIVEGVGTKLDPEVNLWSLAEPWIEKWAIQNLGPEVKLRDGLLKLFDFMKKLPDILEEISNKYENKKKKHEREQNYNYN